MVLSEKAKNETLAIVGSIELKKSKQKNLRKWSIV